MPNIYIDGKKLEVSSDKTIIQAAQDNGLHIPHFCWHPELSVSGNCRMCLVEVGMPRRLPDGSFEKDEHGALQISYMPKLQIACATPASDGMHVRTNTQIVNNARESVMEFFLINHPLDCPICDEAGQCKLQDYAFNHSNGESRFEENKNPKDKRVSWGPNVLYDGERCISCSRCIRFSQEVAGQDVLTFVNRGDHVTIELFENTELDNPYSMNVIDICPVGALTSKDFRFKSRVWDMSFNDSICPGCAKGCNIKIGVRNNEILRIEPRPNPYVNKFWMCDHGRLSYYRKINDERLLTALKKTKEGHQEIGLSDAVKSAYELLKNYKPHEIYFIASPFASNEDNFVFSQLAKNVLKTSHIGAFAYIDDSFADDFLKNRDMTPNYKGTLAVGAQAHGEPLNPKILADLILQKKIKAIYSLDDNILQFPEIKSAIATLELLIVHQSNKNELSDFAHLIFPVSTFAESEGTFTNADGRVQYFGPALVTSENLRFMGMKMSRLDKFGAPNDRWTQHTHRNIRSSWRIIQDIAKLYGADWHYAAAEDVFNEIAKTNENSRYMTYEKIKQHQGLKIGYGNSPEPIVSNYESHYFKPE